ncbi:MAG: hypothetical protein ACAI43_21790 [Phycisphaerae bacterium]
MTALKPIILGWDSSPEPMGTVLGATELRDERAVAHLFARAATFRAQVTARGWRFLIDRYGIVGLIEINREIGWFDPDDDAAAAAEILRTARVAGYDATRGELATLAERVSEDEG